ncbi:methionyl-tRNA formyltransferase, mitochondrial isoform X2 [Patella vulgata]|uniref:methionyl-tRNA formyltransferase, mitochondrial isoform X2 n=1 Tax=Patella vulgata TaxID=6465 RepID=UPI00217F4903|nr:methionyl-tRNA formyltransferase, mitochondrial isoform X2 [Patella vulgata]
MFNGAGHLATEDKTFCTVKKKLDPPWNVLFFGTDEFSVETLKSLHESQLEDKNRLVNKLEVACNPGQSAIRQYAVQFHLKIHDWPVNIEKGKYDVGVLASFGRLIPASVINNFPYGILNVHPSLLPRWRGSAPIIHTVLNGDKVTGISIMQLKPKRFDIGPVLFQKEVAVPYRITAVELCNHLAVLGGEILVNCLCDLPNLSKEEKQQDASKATYAPKITKWIGKLDWKNNTCIDIDQRYRAISSLIPVYTMWRNKKVKLRDIVDPNNTRDLLPAKFKNLPVGSVRFYQKENILLVKCKDGLVGFRKITYQNPMTAKDFFNGFISKTEQKCIVFNCDNNEESCVS